MEDKFREEFDLITKMIFQKAGYTIKKEQPSRNGKIDFIFAKDVVVYCETKAYKSKNIGFGTIRYVIKMLLDDIKSSEQSRALFITTSYVQEKLKREVEQDYGIVIWDRSTLFNILKNSDFDSKLDEKFEQLLLQAQQGIDIESVFVDVVKNDKTLKDYFDILVNSKPNKTNTIDVHKRGDQLYIELEKIEVGKTGWRKFELKCVEIFKYLFEEEDLDLWKEQNITDDNLHRHDLICRIKSKDTFWQTLITSFQSRYILFEFKNYEDQIGQGQIYTTERYLYSKALRSVGFIVARNGINDSAVTAAKGALKEYGKLILILNMKDVKQMLDMKDDGDSPNYYLTDELDKWLIGLSR
ncbi:MAG: restriction endonuclease [Ignavibacteria bacterium]|jgi:hypothetical protein|nr:restriction endonuclease [Ignavibacteria bacterium]